MPFFVLRLLLLIGSLTGLYVGTKKLTENAEKKQWNKGVCGKCSGHFKLIEGTKAAPAKGYKCDVCDNCVWVSYGSDLEYEYKPSKSAKFFYDKPKSAK